MIIIKTKYLFFSSFVALLFFNSLQAQDKSQGSGVLIRRNIITTGQQQPLILLDGIVVDPIQSVTNDSLSVNPPDRSQINLDGIDPKTVETISVLKGDSNTAPYVARYGFRAKNGVILISTKKSTDKIQKE